jgi:hypothetical protein
MLFQHAGSRGGMNGADKRYKAGSGSKPTESCAAALSGSVVLDRGLLCRLAGICSHLQPRRPCPASRTSIAHIV